MVTRTEREALIKSYLCPCCEFRTLYGRGMDEICPVCFWHDDGQDETELDEVWGGPNRDLSLRKARENYKEFGAIEKRFRGEVRNPLPDELERPPVLPRIGNKL